MNWEEFNCDELMIDNYQKYTLTNVRCPKCNSYLRFNNTIVLTSMPVQYQYECQSCGWVGTSYKKWI